MSESELIRLARQGDRDAFGQLAARYEKPVYHQALRLVGNAQDAADVTQEVFFKAWRTLPSFRGDCALSTWLYRLTDHAAIDLLRREKKRTGTVSLDDDHQPVSDLPRSDISPEEQTEQRERQQAVADALAALSPEHRRVLVLREISGLSYDEIAQVLKLSPGTVRSRIARARAALADLLRKTELFSP